jgi:hypothetical protein
MVTEGRGSAELIKQWGSKPKVVPEGLLEAAAELLEDWRITKILTHGIPSVERVVIGFESAASEDDYERCGNVMRQLHALSSPGEGAQIAIRWIINGIPAFDHIIGEIELAARE